MIKYCIERLRDIEQRRKHILEYIKEIDPRDIQLYATIPGIADTTALRIYAGLTILIKSMPLLELIQADHNQETSTSIYQLQNMATPLPERSYIELLGK